MRKENKFIQFDEVEIISTKKHGIILESAYSYHEDMYNYLIDCENEIQIYRENELKKIS